MQRQNVNPHVNELDIDKERLDDSVGILEGLPSLPATRTTSVTGVEVHTLESTHARNHGTGITDGSNNWPATASYNIPPPQIPTKKRNIYFVSAFCSLGGLLFGVDTGSIGSITSMPQFIEVYPTLKNEAVLGALVATILMSASLSSFASGWLSDKYSRKRTIMLGAYIFGIGSALEAGSNNFPMLIIGRLIVGVGEGFFLSAIGVYLVEISPPDVRGRISCMLQLFVTTVDCQLMLARNSHM